MRTCLTCHHLKRPEIDRRLADGEPLAQLAKHYGLGQSSLYRHRVNCLGLGSSNAIKKEAARGSAAIALLPTAATLSESYRELGNRIDQIAKQAQHEGSLRTALAGLTSLRQTFDSLARLAAQDAAARAQTTEPAPDHPDVDGDAIVERLIQEFDQEPRIKARLAAALAQMDDERHASARAPDQNGDPNSGPPVAPAGACEHVIGAPAMPLVPAPVRSALNTAHADHAVVATARSHTVAGHGSAPRANITSSAPPATAAHAPTNGTGNSGAQHDAGPMPRPVNGGQG